MDTKRAQLQQALNGLDASLETMKAQYPDSGDFWSAFAGEADVILDAAGSDDYDWVNSRVDDLLRKHGVAMPPESP